MLVIYDIMIRVSAQPVDSGFNWVSDEIFFIWNRLQDDR